MSWVKFYTYMAILSSTMFLDLRLQDDGEGKGQTAQMMRALLAQEPLSPRGLGQQAPYLAPSSATVLAAGESKSKINRENLALGIIYLIVAFLSFAVSTEDYFTCVQQLETEHTYLDECEGHTHPIVTILSCVIGLVIMATVLLMLVQREQA